MSLSRSALVTVVAGIGLYGAFEAGNRFGKNSEKVADLEYKLAESEVALLRRINEIQNSLNNSMKR